MCVCNLFLSSKDVYTSIIINLKDFLLTETKVEIYYKRFFPNEISFIKTELCFNLSVALIMEILWWYNQTTHMYFIV